MSVPIWFRLVASVVAGSTWPTSRVAVSVSKSQPKTLATVRHPPLRSICFLLANSATTTTGENKKILKETLTRFSIILFFSFSLRHDKTTLLPMTQPSAPLTIFIPTQLGFFIYKYVIHHQPWLTDDFLSIFSSTFADDSSFPFRVVEK